MNYKQQIQNALVMVGLHQEQITNIQNGAPIVGDLGVLDSLGLVRLISALGAELEDQDIDLFDLLHDMDVSPDQAFSSHASISQFLRQVTLAPVAEAV